MTGHPVHLASISRPASITAGTPWGFHVFTMPTVAATLRGQDDTIGNPPAMPFRLDTQGALITLQADAQSLRQFMGSSVVLVCFQMSELPLTMTQMATFPDDRFTGFREPDLYSSTVPASLTALSYKVVNESPATELQGNCLDYLQDGVPATYALLSPITNMAITEWYGVSAQQTLVMPAPPASPDEAVILRSVTRKASEGALVVQRFDYEEKHLETPEESAFGWNSASYDSTMPGTGGVAGAGAHRYFGSEKVSSPNPTKYIFLDTNICRQEANTRHGSFFTGLGDDSVFTLSIHMVIEKAPEIGSEFAQYASVPPPRDPQALLAASIASKLMPVGAPASHNSFGSFLNGVMKGVNQVFQPVKAIAGVARHLPGPLGKAAGMVHQLGGILEPGESSPRHMSSQHHDTRSAAERVVRAEEKALEAPRRRRGGRRGAEERVKVRHAGNKEIVEIPDSRRR